MLGRSVSSSRSLLRLHVHARRVVVRFQPFQCQPTPILASRTLAAYPQRSYATTPGRPRSTVGEPTKTVKRAVKRASTTSDGGEAGRKNQARKKTAPAKKAKAKPKARKPKELTPEQQERKAVRTEKQKMSALKKAALSPPNDGVSYSAYHAFLKETMNGKDLGGSNHQEKLGDAASSASRAWKNISPSQHEHYNHLAQQVRQTAAAEHKRWVESHTPEEIREANRARASLKRLDPSQKGKRRYMPIKDERAVKRPVTAYVQFTINRQASGDFRNIPLVERAKLLSQEWRALSEGEKKKYKDLQSEDLSRYTSEYTSTFGHTPPGQQAAAAAA